MIKKLMIVALLLLPLNGCYFKIKLDTKTIVSINTDVQKKIQDASKNIPKEDKDTAYKMFMGWSMLIKSAVPGTTIDAWNQFDKVQKIYGWEKKKYPELTAAVKDVLQSSGLALTIPKKIEEVKDTLPPIIESIAEGLKE